MISKNTSACNKPSHECTQKCIYFFQVLHMDPKLAGYLKLQLNVDELRPMQIRDQDRPHGCDFCPKAFKNKEKLDRHVSCVHEKARPFTCLTCGVSFGRKDKLKRHVSTIHLEEKPFLCNHCDHKTSRRDRMRKHLVNVHSLSEDDFMVVKC